MGEIFTYTLRDGQPKTRQKEERKIVRDSEKMDGKIETQRDASVYFINTELQINFCGSFNALDYTPSSLCHSEGPGFGEHR